MLNLLNSQDSCNKDQSKLPSNQEIIEDWDRQEDPNNNSNKEEPWAEEHQMTEVSKDLEEAESKDRGEKAHNKFKKINPSETQQATPSQHM
jgi:hypothetical protein